ncbi:hypothetical protein ACFLYZ_01245 [Thermodesulfobacteriota bacterium]
MRKQKYVKLVGAMLDEETHKLLIEATDQKEVSISEYVRGIVERELRKEALNHE